MSIHNPMQQRAVLTADTNQSQPVKVTLSPVPVLRGVQLAPGDRILINLDESQPDAYSIISILQGLSEQFARTPDVREFTVNDVLCSRRNNDIEKHVQVISEFVMEHLVYTRDPVGAEYVISPINLIAQLKAGGTPAGDCDDHVLLMNSMLGSVGIPTKVVGVKLYNSAVFNHVIGSAFYDGIWHDIDPCAKEAEQPTYYDKLVAS